MNKNLGTLIPVYNAENYLYYCVNSVLEQNPNEIILVDDGSTDKSAEICDEYALQDSRVVVIHKKNKGASDTRNVALKCTKSEYIHFVDSDDWVYEKDAYKAYWQEIQFHKPEILFSRLIRFSEDLSEQQELQPEYSSGSLFEGNVLKEVLKKQYVLTLTSPVNKMFNREFLIQNDLFFTVGLDHEEDEWLPRVIANAKKVCFSNDILYGVRFRETGTLSAIPNEQTRARKAKSKIKIAVSGMDYMLQKKLDKETLQFVAEYYWGYMLDAVISANQLTDKALQKDVFTYLKENKRFFNNKKFLKSKTWKLQGFLFKIFGVEFTAKLLAKRYAKQG